MVRRKESFAALVERAGMAEVTFIFIKLETGAVECATMQRVCNRDLDTVCSSKGCRRSEIVYR
jgi:hypothetical protein